MIPQIHPEQAHELIDGSTLFVDIRDPQSYGMSHIRDAVHLDNDSLTKFLADVPMNTRLVVYCYHGNSSKGGTAWEHPNGLWVYITDARGLLVCDYRPVVARKIYQPLLPLRPAGRESFRWHVIRGGV